MASRPSLIVHAEEAKLPKSVKTEAELALEIYHNGYDDGYRNGRDGEIRERVKHLEIDVEEATALDRLLAHEFIPYDDIGIIARRLMRRIDLFVHHSDKKENGNRKAHS